MIAIEDIRDRESLQQWLGEWPRVEGKSDDEARAIAVTIAFRAEMRALPLWWEWTTGKFARTHNLTVLPLLREKLVLGNEPLKQVPGDGGVPVPAIADRNRKASMAAFATQGRTYGADAVARAAGGDSFSAYAAFIDSVTDAVKIEQLWTEIRADCRFIADYQDIVSKPVWAEATVGFSKQWSRVKSASGPEWSFWIKWYDDALAGNPQNWKMLEQIALIDTAVWDAGAKAISKRIELIEEQHKLASDVKDLRKSYEEIRPQLPALAPRSHNNPPELIEEMSLAQSGYEIIWASLVEVETELEKNKPSAPALKRWGLSILEACKSIASYCADLGDVALTKAAEEFGSAGGKWTVRGVAAYLVAQNPGAQSFAGKIVEYAEKLAQFP